MAIINDQENIVHHGLTSGVPVESALNRRIPRVALFGAAPDTPNMGVSALHDSVIHSVSQFIDPVEFVIFDNTVGPPSIKEKSAFRKGTTLIGHGARVGQRYYLPENLTTAAFAANLGICGRYCNRLIRLVDSCDAVLDISGGDSFSDIYGRERFRLIYLPKLIAIARDKPLLLLPQTYGPFKDSGIRKLASSVIQKASMAWARDENSFDILKEILGTSFDASRHHCGLDMAFALPSRYPAGKLDESIKYWLADTDKSQPLVGFNVSGLIYNDPTAASDKFGFKADYHKAIVGFLCSLLSKTEARLLLIPHVMDKAGHYESDLAACQEVARALSAHAERVKVSPGTVDHSEVKWIISRMDWFCGTRMHSTIAALSSGVPAASISYSDKTLGVFEACGQGRHVLDPRKLNTLTIAEELLRSFNERTISASELRAYEPGMAAGLTSQTKLIVDFVRKTADRSHTSKQRAAGLMGPTKML